jgi:hypothetical protein
MRSGDLYVFYQDGRVEGTAFLSMFVLWARDAYMKLPEVLRNKLPYPS